jgi:hypothetical protein
MQKQIQKYWYRTYNVLYTWLKFVNAIVPKKIKRRLQLKPCVYNVTKT